MKKLYELLVRFDADGNFQGAHTIEWGDNGLPEPARPVKPEDWPAVASAVNAAAVEGANKLKETLAAEEEAHKATQAALEEKESRIAVLEASQPSLSLGTTSGE